MRLTRLTMTACLPATLILAAALSCPPVLAAHAEDDSFSSTTLDSCRWFDWSRNGRSASGAGLQLQTSASEIYSDGRVISQYMISGDIGMEVSVAAGAGFEEPIAPSAQMYAAFGLWADNSNSLFIAVAKNIDQPVIRVLRRSSAGGFENFPDIPIASPAAQLRISQVGHQVTLAYNTDGMWTTAAAVASFPDGAYVSLQASTVSLQRQFVASFSNFQITSGSTTYRPYVRGELIRSDKFMPGAVVTDYIYSRIWSGKWHAADPLQTLFGNGVKWIRTGVTTVSVPALRDTSVAQWASLPWQNSYWSSQEAAGQMLKEAAATGLRLNLFLMLSDQGAHAGAQNAPLEWQGLSVADTALALKQYAQSVVAAYRAEGLSVEIYDVGNEIEWGILNFRPGDRIPIPAGVEIASDMNFMRSEVWTTEAELLKAAIDGIRTADPAAKIVLHIAGLSITPGDILVKAFFKAMVDFGVPFDFAGLSLPYADVPWRLNQYSTDCWFQRLQETTDYLATLGKRTIFSEGSYPHSPTGMVLANAMAEFPFTAEGQASWVRELLRFGNNSPSVAGFHYFYPEWHSAMNPANPNSPVLSSGGLFDANESPLRAMAEFGNGRSVVTTDSDRIFNWAETLLPNLLSPYRPASQSVGSYYLRYYPNTNSYLGTSGGRVYYYDANGGTSVLDLGNVSDYLPGAASAGY